MAEKKPRLTSPVGIACFEHVWEPDAMEEGKEKRYSVLLVFNEEVSGDLKKALSELKQKCMAAATEKFGEDTWRALHKKGKFRFPWRKASDYDEYGAPFDEDGAMMCSFQSKSPPGVVDRRAKPITDRSEFYSGALARVTYAVWPYDSNGNKGVTLLLNNVQKIKDGERLSGKPSAEEDFDAVEGGSDDADEEDLDI